MNQVAVTSRVTHANLDATGRDPLWPLGSCANPIPSGDSRPGWESDVLGHGVVHGEISDIAGTGSKKSR